MFRLIGIFVTAVIILSCSGQQEESGSSPLKLNQIQILGSHNSYKVAIDSALLEIIRERDSSSARALNYAHLPIPEQLNMGLRNLEYDVFHDPEGGRYTNPYGLQQLKKAGLPYKPFDTADKLEEPGLKVFHIQDIDFRSHHLLFRDALKELKTWSKKHPDHLPVFVTINAKDGPGDREEFTRPLSFTERALDSIDMELEQYLGKNNLIIPEIIKRENKTLKASVMENGWPALNKVRGKFLFILDQNGEKMERYIKNHPSLKNRLMFVNAPAGYPEAATMIINDPIGSGDKIRKMVKKGFIVRTRADANTLEARQNNYSRWEAARKSGAQIITTDYYVPSQTFESEYQVGMDHVYRKNPLLK